MQDDPRGRDGRSLESRIAALESQADLLGQRVGQLEAYVNDLQLVVLYLASCAETQGRLRGLMTGRPPA